MTQVRTRILALFIIVGSIANPNTADAISAWFRTREIAKGYAYTAIALLIAYYRTEREIQQYTKPVLPKVEQFIRAELQKLQVSGWQTIRIIQHPYKSMATIDTLCLEKYLVDQITQTGDKHYEARAVIHHEAGHLKHRHVLVSAALAPLLSVASSYCSWALVDYVYPPKKIDDTFTGLIHLSLDIGLIFYILGPFVSRMCEWQADECITDDPRVLAGGIRLLTHGLRQSSAYFDSLVEQFPIKGRLQRWYHTCELISTHPTLEKRIRRLQQRLANHPDKQLLPPQELAYLLNPQLTAKA